MTVSLHDAIATPLPRQSQLHQRLRPGDFLDCYAIDSRMGPREAAEVITSFPAWARFLSLLRNVLVAPLGLRTKTPKDQDCVSIFPPASSTLMMRLLKSVPYQTRTEKWRQATTL